MIRESEIANFLDLIKHITQSRNFKSMGNSAKSKKKHRYQDTDSDTQQETKQRKIVRRSQEDCSTKDESKPEAQFEHKMLKITHDIKRKPKSFKFDTLCREVQFASDADISDKLNRIRNTNLYENYCESIKRKRKQRIDKMFRNSEHELARNVCNISDTVHFNSNQEPKPERESPFVKSKTLKPGLQSIKLKRSPIQKSKKRMQPNQLNIQKFKSVKMPKLQNQSSLPKKRSNPKIEKYFNMIAKKKASINKAGELEGWAQEEDRTCFNIDYF